MRYKYLCTDIKTLHENKNSTFNKNSECLPINS